MKKRKVHNELIYLVVEFNSRSKIAELLEGITKVTVTLGKSRIHTNALLIIKYALRKVSQLKMRCAEKKQVF